MVEALFRRHLSSVAEFEPQLRLAMTRRPRPRRAALYAQLFDEGAWERLAALFHQQYCRAAMPATAPLLVAIGAGLTAQDAQLLPWRALTLTLTLTPTLTPTLSPTLTSP